MSPRPDLLAALPELIAARLRDGLPQLRECAGMVGAFDLSDLKREGVAAPAVRVTILGINRLGTEAGPRRRWAASMAAYVITKDALGLGRDAAALAIVQALLTKIPEEHWSEPGCGPASDVEARVIVGRAAREITTHLSAVTWRQPLVLDALPSGEPLPIALYVGEAPL